MVITRKSYGGWAMLFAFGLSACLPMRSAEPLVKQTLNGRVRGKAINEGKVLAFQGIPYAAPPLGNLRWQPPQPVASWEGERDATHYGHHCAQNPVFPDMIFQDSATPADVGSEDCLTLNVYVPASVRTKKLPVMFWIHGGGYAGGSSSEPRHNGDFLPLKGVVLVTINYRLGAFGFLALPELAQEQGGASGNYGLMDVVAALQWVKHNIAAFGGDPNCITLFGESAGSFAVSTLMTVPSAHGLFQRAIGESGGAVTTGTLAIEDATLVGPRNLAWAQGAGAGTVAALRAWSTAQVLAAAAKKGPLAFVPVLDGRFLTESVVASYAAGRETRVPLLSGTNKDEGYAATGMTASKWRTAAEQRFKDKADRFLTLYPGTTDSEAAQSAADFAGDQFVVYSTWKWIELDRERGDRNIYRYELDLAAPPSKFHPDWSAFHSDDIEYVFGTLATRPGAQWREEDYTLSEQIMSYWTNFAKTGNPNGRDVHGSQLPYWPQYSRDNLVLHLDHPITSAADLKRARYEFLQEQER